MLFILSAGQKISIHALCEEGDPLLVAAQHDGVISIHALCEEGDRFIIASTVSLSIFLSTPSARRATPRPSKTQGLRFISIHALCEEGDSLRP